MKEIVESKLNFSGKNIPEKVSKILPLALLEEVSTIIVEDLNETLRLLRDGYATPAMLMAGRIFENTVFDYYNEEYFDVNQDDDDDNDGDGDGDDGEGEQSNLLSLNLNDLYGFQYLENNDASSGETESEEEELSDKLGKRIEQLRAIVGEEVVEEFRTLKNLRNEAVHGDRRYGIKAATNFTKRVLRVVVLSYNGNHCVVPP